jgi:hypothetical protein
MGQRRSVTVVNWMPRRGNSNNASRRRTELRFFPEFGIDLMIRHGDAELAIHVAH